MIMPKDLTMKQPLADRFRITATLTKKSLTDNNDANFAELLRVDNGGRKNSQ